VDIVPGKLLMWRNNFSKDAVENIQHYGEVCVLISRSPSRIDRFATCLMIL